MLQADCSDDDCCFEFDRYCSSNDRCYCCRCLQRCSNVAEYSDGRCSEAGDDRYSATDGYCCSNAGGVAVIGEAGGVVGWKGGC